MIVATALVEGLKIALIAMVLVHCVALIVKMGS